MTSFDIYTVKKSDSTVLYTLILEVSQKVLFTVMAGR